MICVGGNIRTELSENFSGKFGEIRAKIFRNPKSLLAPTPMYFCQQIVACPSSKRFVKALKIGFS